MVCELKSKEFDSLTLLSLFLFITFFFVEVFPLVRGHFAKLHDTFIEKTTILDKSFVLPKIATVEQENKCCLLMEVFT